MAVRSPTQVATRRRIEVGIRVAAPFLDLVLAVGDRVSRVTGRDAIEPEPPRRSLAARGRTPVGGAPDRV